MNRPKLAPAICAACAQPFQARASDVRRGFGRACSPRCSGKLRGLGHRPASHPSAVASHPLPQDVPPSIRAHANQPEAQWKKDC